MSKFFSLFMVAAILLGAALGFSLLQAPAANVDAPERFMASNCAADIEQIAKEPHSIRDPDARAEVREYLLDRLEGMGMETKVFNYDGGYDEFFDMDVDVNNILATTPGDYDSYIMLMAHYDSSVGKRVGEMDGSHGAADDGYGLAVILEVVRLMQDLPQPHVNGIKVLFTDAEETTGTAPTYGSAFAVEEPEVTDKVSFTINIEAHGIRGPAMMFETSANNANVIGLYKEANMPLALSLANAIYQKMPNDTDLTVFKKAGFSGINFGVSDSVAEYHTPEDNYINIDLRALQSYGEQVTPVVRAFVTDDAYSDVNWTAAGYDVQYFNIAPNVLVVYPPAVAWVFFILCAGALGYALWRAKAGGIVKSLAWAGLLLGVALVFAAAGFGISHLVATTRIPFSLTYMPSIAHADAIMAVTAILEIIAFALLAYFGVRKAGEPDKLMLGGAVVQFIVTVLVMILLPSASFIFLFSCLLTSACVIVLKMTEWGRLLAGIVVVYGISQVIMIFWLFYLSLTIGALSVLLALLGLYLCGIVPCAVAVAHRAAHPEPQQAEVPAAPEAPVA